VQRVELQHSVWIDLAGREEPPSALAVHPALAESLHHREKHGKLREVDGQVLFVLRHLSWDGRDVRAADLALVSSERFLVTAHEEPIPALATVREELAQGRLSPSVGSVVWRLADLLVAEYLAILDRLHAQAHRLETATLFDPRPKVLEELLLMKRNLIFFRTHVAGCREVVNLLARLDLPGVEPRLRPYFVDVYDHLILAVETSDMFRDLLSSAVEAYLSTISNRLNEVMKTLTIIATIMMPLTVITGIYGMNIHIPEAEWEYGYPFVLALMALVVGTMLYYFRRRRWL
jgi:magnesium transporter